MVLEGLRSGHLLASSRGFHYYASLCLKNTPREKMRTTWEGMLVR